MKDILCTQRDVITEDLLGKKREQVQSVLSQGGEGKM
jgi:hypothetical protein